MPFARVGCAPGWVVRWLRGLSKRVPRALCGRPGYPTTGLPAAFSATERPFRGSADTTVHFNLCPSQRVSHSLTTPAGTQIRHSPAGRAFFRQVCLGVGQVYHRHCHFTHSADSGLRLAGNIRELGYAIERSAIISSSTIAKLSLPFNTSRSVTGQLIVSSRKRWLKTKGNSSCAL